LFLTDLRADQEMVLLAMIQASTCDAFHTATEVTINTVESFRAAADALKRE
jgi:hypothetical protein